MTDSIDTISSDAFAALRDVIAVLADPKRTHEKLVELEARIKDAKKAEHRAATVRERLSIEAARERQELDERRGELAKKGRELLAREMQVDQREKTVERIMHRDPIGPGGLTREVYDGTS
jgi:hypothetical protein